MAESKSKMSILWSWTKGFLRLAALLLLLYFFICSLTFLEGSFRLLGGRKASQIFESEFLHNPVVGLMIGVLFTVLVQSSSTCTSVVVSLVASEGIKKIESPP